MTTFTTTRTPETQRKILNVATAIETDAARYNQLWFAQMRRDDWLGTPDGEFAVVSEAACHMAYCLGGWNWVLHHVTEESTIYPNGYDGDDQWMRYDFDVSTETLMEAVRNDFQLDDASAALLCASNWTPRPGLTPANALRAIALGASVVDVTHPDHVKLWAL